MVRQLRVTFTITLYCNTSHGNERRSIFITRKDYVHFKDLDVEIVIGRMALYHRVSREEISRRGRENLLRKQAIYLTKKMVLKNNDQIGRHFGISGSAVNHQYQWVSKKMKMDRSFSKQMKDIERFISSKI